MQPAKVLSTSYQQNRGGKKVLTCVAEIRKGQNVTAEYIQGLGDASNPISGESIVVFPRAQSFGGWLALGSVDIINALQVDRGVKVIYGRNTAGTAKTKITLTSANIVVEIPGQASIELLENEVVLNDGVGVAVEADRLQSSLDAFSGLILAELQKIAALLEPKSPSNPYVAPESLPIDVSAAKSESIKLP